MAADPTTQSGVDAPRGVAPLAAEEPRLARAATIIAGLTMASRLAGFGRSLVFVWAVGAGTLGDVYKTTNTVPNIIFEIIAGGALASLIVPMLVGSVTRGDRATAGATTSALLTWVLTLLVPVAIAVAVAAAPIVRLLDHDPSPATVAVGADMLRMFAPQLPLYGVGLVLAGVLQAYRQFVWPVLAPLLSSLTVVGAYAVFALVAGRAPGVDQVSDVGVLILSAGTTLGVVVLSLCLFLPLRHLRLPLRPTYRFTAEAGQLVRRLALAGAVTVGAQQLAVMLVIALANGGPAGSLVIYDLAEKIYLLPWAVLALPLATSAYPVLAQAAARGDRAGYAAVLAPATRGLLLFSCLGAAVLAALAAPVARVLAAISAGSPPVGVIAAGVAGFAPGLIGYALFALLARALYARGDTRLAAVATVVGWATVALASVGLARLMPGTDRVAALTVANSAGMLVLGGVLVAAVVRRAGRAAVAGAGRAGAAGLFAGAGAAGAGYAVARLTGDAATLSVAAALGQGMLCGVVVTVVFVVVAYAVDRQDVRPALVTLARRVRRRRHAGRP